MIAVAVKVLVDSTYRLWGKFAQVCTSLLLAEPKLPCASCCLWFASAVETANSHRRGNEQPGGLFTVQTTPLNAQTFFEYFNVSTTAAVQLRGLEVPPNAYPQRLAVMLYFDRSYWRCTVSRGHLLIKKNRIISGSGWISYF